MKQKFKRLKFSEEPVLHIHRYVVAICSLVNKDEMNREYHYCVNKKEVDEIIETKVKKGNYAEVYKATHDFKFAKLRVS